jgi:predicted nucleic acid-binding protein
VAEEYGLKITGILGILVKAKKDGLIPEVKSCMEMLRENAGFRINPKLFKVILKAVGEM